MLLELPCASCGCIDGLTGRAGLGGSEAQLVMSEYVICSVPLEWGQEISILHKLNGSSPGLCKRKRQLEEFYLLVLRQVLCGD